MPDPKKNVAYSFEVGLIDQANRPAFKSNPTLATGDVQVSIGGGAYADLATLPSVSPAGSEKVVVAVSQDEMNGDRIAVRFKDQAGAEWDDLLVTINTTVRTIDDQLTLTPAEEALIAAAVAARVYEGTLTFEGMMRLILSACLLKSTGAEINAPNFRDLADSKNRISGTVDVNGNRLTVVIDAS